MNLALDLTKRYTYADYLTWLDDRRRELIDGFIKMMSAPMTQHQGVGVNLIIRLYNLIEKRKGKCKVLYDIDVRLPRNGETADSDIYTVVRPDICVICDQSKIEDRGCLGAPDLIVEIQSQSTARYDLTEKFNLYEASGVHEYWVVFPYDKYVKVFLLQTDGKYNEGTKYEKGKIPVHIFEGCKIDIKKIF